MRIYGEFGTIARTFEFFGLLINGDSVAYVSYALKTLPFMVGETKFAWDGCSKLDCLRWDSSEASGSTFLDLCPWELCFSLVSPLWELCYSLAFG